MKITLIGPVYPYVGGISHYTGLLYKALSKENTVDLISFKMMYPKLLTGKKQRDYSDDTFKIEETRYLINTANPFNILGVAKKINENKPDAVLLQWWHPYFTPCYRILVNHLDKSIRVLFTCHNVFPHERFPFDKHLTRSILKKGDGFIIHSKRDENDLLSIKNDAVRIYNPHPTYNAFKQRGITKTQARKEIIDSDKFDINDSSKILLFFGFVREYKGLKYALKAMPEIYRKYPEVRLLIVGSFGKNKDEYLSLIESLNIKKCVCIKDTYTPDSEVEKYFAACDLAVLPYTDATQSGIAQIAFGFEKPCIVTNVGGLPDVVKDGETGYIIPPMDPKSIYEAVSKYFASSSTDKMHDSIREDSARFSWDRMAESVKSLYLEVRKNKITRQVPSIF